MRVSLKGRARRAVDAFLVRAVVEGGARRAVGACLVLGNTEMRSGNSSHFLQGRGPRMVECGTFG